MRVYLEQFDPPGLTRQARLDALTEACNRKFQELEKELARMEARHTIEYADRCAAESLVGDLERKRDKFRAERDARQREYENLLRAGEDQDNAFEESLARASKLNAC